LAAGVHAHVGGRMEEVVAVPGGHFVAVFRHAAFLFKVWYRPGRCQAAVSMQRYLSSVKASSPWREPSRPMPDCFQPPKGIGPPVILTRLIATTPYSSARPSRIWRAPFSVTT